MFGLRWKRKYQDLEGRHRKALADRSRLETENKRLTSALATADDRDARRPVVVWKVAKGKRGQCWGKGFLKGRFIGSFHRKTKDEVVATVRAMDGMRVRVQLETDN